MEYCVCERVGATVISDITELRHTFTGEQVPKPGSKNKKRKHDSSSHTDTDQTVYVALLMDEWPATTSAASSHKREHDVIQTLIDRQEENKDGDCIYVVHKEWLKDSLLTQERQDPARYKINNDESRTPSEHKSASNTKELPSPAISTKSNKHKNTNTNASDLHNNNKSDSASTPGNRTRTSTQKQSTDSTKKKKQKT